MGSWVSHSLIKVVVTGWLAKAQGCWPGACPVLAPQRRGSEGAGVGCDAGWEPRPQSAPPGWKCQPGREGQALRTKARILQSSEVWRKTLRTA